MGNSNNGTDTEFQKLKLLYEENSTQFRYFLTWRQLILAGYFSAVAALALAFKWAMEKESHMLPLFPLAGALVSLLVWALERRNTELYRLTSKVGTRLEEKMGLTVMGHFGEYAKSPAQETRHFMILATFYLGSGALMLLLSIVLSWEG